MYIEQQHIDTYGPVVRMNIQVTHSKWTLKLLSLGWHSMYSMHAYAMHLMSESRASQTQLMPGRFTQYFMCMP